MQTVSTCLWFDEQAQEAAAFYVSLFPNSRIVDTKYYLEGSPRPAGSVLTVQFTLDGTECVALNGGQTTKPSQPVARLQIRQSPASACMTQFAVEHRLPSL